MNYEISFLKALFLTIIIESLCLIVIIKYFLKDKITINTWLILITGFTCSFATLPYIWFILPVFIKTKIIYNIVSELLAIIAEAIIIAGFMKFKLKYVIVLSVSCNMLSYVVGLIIK